MASSLQAEAINLKLEQLKIYKRGATSSPRISDFSPDLFVRCCKGNLLCSEQFVVRLSLSFYSALTLEAVGTLTLNPNPPTPTRPHATKG